MEAARVAASRGHNVVLFEKNQLGGQLNMAVVPPGKQDIQYLLDFEKHELDRLGVEIRFQALDVATVQSERPDAVILAVGAEPFLPDISGGCQRPSVLTAWQVLREHEIKGNDIVVIGGGQVGLETAQYLAYLGKKVTIAEQLGTVGSDMDRTSFLLLTFHLIELGVTILTRAAARKIEEGGIWITHRGKDRFLKTELVVLALGARSKVELKEGLRKTSIAFHQAGDCVSVRRFADAIAEGFESALDI